MASPSHLPVGADLAISSIERMIVESEVGPGERLPTERDLATRFGVSRGSVREAIRTLASQGVLEARVGAGTYVTSLDPETLLGSRRFGLGLMRAERLDDLLELRRALDGLVAYSAAGKLSTYDHGHLRGLIDLMASDGAVEDRIAADVEFHRLIAVRSGNEVVAALLDTLSVDTEALRVRRGATDAHATSAMRDEHLEIADALMRGDGPSARSAAEAHVTNLMLWLSVHRSESE